MKYIVLFLLIAFFCQSSVHYKKVMLTDPGALCLDGSLGAYYVADGDPKKIALIFEGGGWCGGQDLNSTIDDCYQRSKTDLGSSTKYGESFQYADGMFGDNPENIFKNWTKIYLKYCDGTAHQGYRLNSVTYKGSQIHFRGHNVTIGQLNSIDASLKLFSEATHIVVAGQSAGGLAVFTWLNYIASRAITKQIWGIPDCGIFLDSMNVGTKTHAYRNQFQNFMKLSNAEIDPPDSACVTANPNQKWKCLFAQYLQAYLTVPIFPVQSLYDSWCIPNILGIHCPANASLQKCTTKERATIEQYHQNKSKLLEEIGKTKANGYWAPICVNHCYTADYKFYGPQFTIPSDSQFSISVCVKNWMEGTWRNNKHMDTGSWPENKGCVGLQKKRSSLFEKKDKTVEILIQTS